VVSKLSKDKNSTEFIDPNRLAIHDFETALITCLRSSSPELLNVNALSEAGLLKEKIIKLLQVPLNADVITFHDIASIERHLLLQATEGVVSLLQTKRFNFGQDIARQLKSQNLGRKLGLKQKILDQIPNKIIEMSSLVWTKELSNTLGYETVYIFNSYIFFHEITEMGWGNVQSFLVPISHSRAQNITGLSL